MTFHIRERRPNGQLLGIFVDDRRNPEGAGDLPRRRRQDHQGRARHVPGAQERQRAAASQSEKENPRDPTIVNYDRYAFDLSRSDRPARPAHMSTRDRYIWELLWPTTGTRRRPSPRQDAGRNARPDFRAVLSVRLHDHHLRLSRRAAHHPPEPRASLAGAAIVVAVVAPARLCQHRAEPAHPWALAIQYVAARGRRRLGLYASSRARDRAAGLPHQCDERHDARGSRASRRCDQRVRRRYVAR